MNPPLAIPPSWNRQRWCGAVALLFLAQLALLFVFSEKPPAPAVVPTAGARITLLLDPNVNRQVLETLGASDPALFALASPKSFSGPGWLNVPPRQHRLQEWTEPNPALAPNPPLVGGLFSAFLRTNLSALEVGVEKVSPEIRSLARPLLSLPLLTTNLGPPEIARPQVTRPRTAPVWSVADAREPIVWLAPSLGSVGAAWSTLAVTNVAAPPQPFVAPAPRPVAPRPGFAPPPGDIKSTNAPRSQLPPASSPRRPAPLRA